jgi:hypothetical protein
MARVGGTIMECYIRDVTTLFHYKWISSRDLGLKELRIFRTEVILALPSSFSVGMVRPLNFQELDPLVVSFALGFFKNGNGMLMIGQVLLEINLFEVDSVLGRLEALAELRHVKHIVHI